jgi:hypothetical protein
MNDKRKSIYWLNANVIIANGGSRRQLLDFREVSVDGISELKAQPIGETVVIFNRLSASFQVLLHPLQPAAEVGIFLFT